MAGAGARAGRRGIPKRKPNFTLQEIDILMSEVLRYEQLLFGASSTNVNAYEKQKIWWRITNKINAAGRNQRDIGEVKNRWRGLRRRANDKITRHRQERQAPPDVRGYPAPRGAEPREPELGPQWGLHGVCPLDAPPGSGDVPAPQALQVFGSTSAVGPHSLRVSSAALKEMPLKTCGASEGPAAEDPERCWGRV